MRNEPESDREEGMREDGDVVVRTHFQDMNAAPYEQESDETLRLASDLAAATDPGSGEEIPDLSDWAGPGFGGAARTFGRFRILRELGRGGFGIVFLAVDPDLRRQVALKLPHAGAASTPEVKERFVREARAAAAIDHPNLVPLYEAGDVGSVQYLASAYCEGPTLARWLKEQNGPVAPRVAGRLIRDMADAVQHAHERGVLHRDLKPSNVLMQRRPPTQVGPEDPTRDSSECSGYIPRITDFGLARMMDRPNEEMTATFVAMGSAPYMPPEQAEGKKVGPAADVYGLGAILYTLLCRRPPHCGKTDLETLRKAIEEEPIPPHSLPRDSPRPRGDLPLVPGEGPGASISLRPRPVRGPGPVPGRQADPGQAHRPPRASQTQGPTQSFRRDPLLHQHGPGRDDPGRNFLVPIEARRGLESRPSS